MKACFGVCLGCGGNRDQGKRKLMAQAVEKYADQVVLTNDNPRFEDPVAITNDVQKRVFKKFKLQCYS